LFVFIPFSQCLPSNLGFIFRLSSLSRSNEQKMTPTPRQSDIIQAVRAQGPQTIEALAESFQVTLQTVRRDVTRLAEAGLLARFHGGVRLPESTTENIAYRQRQALAADEKRRIAQAIAQRVPNGCSLVMNVGTTIEAVAHELLGHTDLRVITNNLNVAALLSTNRSCEVIVAGGVVRATDQAITGEATVDFIRQFKVDIGLIGISGIEADGTLRDFDYREVRVARTIIEQSRQVWLATDHTKFKRDAMVKLADISEIDTVFTDQTPPQKIQDLMSQHGVNCVIA
jgi:DeoR family transcriptional regulator, glycerol-3-phosphate regulon repressor